MNDNMTRPMVETIAGTGQVVEDRIYIADTNNHRIRVADLSSAQVTTLGIFMGDP